MHAFILFFLFFFFVAFFFILYYASYRLAYSMFGFLVILFIL